VSTIRRVVAGRASPVWLEQAAMVTLTLLAAFFAFEEIGALVYTGGLVLTNVEAVLYLGLGFWLLACAARGTLPRAPRSVAAAALVWLVVMVLSALAAPSHRLVALRFVGRMASGVLLVWAVYDLARTARRWQILARVLALGGLAVGLLGLGEAAGVPAVVRFLASFKFAPTYVGELLRVSSTLSYATIASMVLEMTCPLLLAWVLTARRRPVRLLLACGLLATLTAQLLTLTRGGVIALWAAFGLMAAWAAWQRRRYVLLGALAAAGALLAVVVAVLVLIPATRYRLASESVEAWYSATYNTPAQLEARAGETVSVPLTLANAGVRTWETGGSNPYMLSYHLVRPDGAPVELEGQRIPLPHDVLPGATVEVLAPLAVPESPGEYVIEWDMLQEDVTWFSDRDSPPGLTRLTVYEGLAPDTRQPSPADSSPAPGYASSVDARSRFSLWRVGWSMFLERSILGVGPDNYRWLHGAYSGTPGKGTRVHANNLYVEWLADTGALGFAAFLWLTWQLIRHAYGLLRGSREPGWIAWRLALLGGLAAWYIHGVFDCFYEFTPTYVALAFLCGLALASPSAGQEG